MKAMPGKGVSIILPALNNEEETIGRIIDEIPGEEMASLSLLVAAPIACWRQHSG